MKLKDQGVNTFNEVCGYIEILRNEAVKLQSAKSIKDDTSVIFYRGRESAFNRVLGILKQWQEESP
jgi:hypothetical protein